MRRGLDLGGVLIQKLRSKTVWLRRCRTNRFRRRRSGDSIWGQRDDGDLLFRRLPDHVICTIISSLPIKDAARTSAVSRQWRHRWKYCLNLDLDLDDIDPDTEEFPKIELHRRRELNYIRWVNRVVRCHQGETLQAFRISTALGKKHAAHIDKWLLFALRKNAGNIVVDLCKYSFIMLTVDRHYELRKETITGHYRSLRNLTLKNVMLGSLDFACFDSLEALTLESSSVSQQHIASITNNCYRLRSLVLLRCKGPTTLEFQFPPSHPINHLNITRYTYDRKREVQISVVAPNLEWLECVTNSSTTYTIRKIPKLKRLSLLLNSSFDSEGTQPFRYAMDSLAHDAPNLEKLHMSLYTNKLGLDIQELPDVAAMKSLPKFNMLREISLSDGYVCAHHFTKLVMILLSMSPSLHTLELQLGSDSRRYCEDLDHAKRDPDQFDYPHRALKVVKIFGFQYCKRNLDAIVCLLQNAPNLVTMQIKIEYIDHEQDGLYDTTPVKNWHKISQKTKTWLEKNVSFRARLGFI